MVKKSINQNTKDIYTKVFLEAAGHESDVENVKKYNPVFWYNYRSKKEGGLRLTDQGLEFIVDRADLKTYQIELPKEFKFTAQSFIWLDQYLKSPYYIDKKYITVISEKAAFELYLFSGDIKKFGQAKSLSKRLAQD